MYLKFIEKQTPMEVTIEGDENSVGVIFGKYYALDSDTSFFMESEKLYQEFDYFTSDTFLNISFLRGAIRYSCLGKPVGKKEEQGEYLVQIQQRTAIVTTTRRTHHRDELQMEAKLFGLSAETFESQHELCKQEEVEVDGAVFDLSPGGIGFVTNTLFESEYEPYFLVEFELSPRDKFLLPARLMRRGDSPQTMRYKYDFGLAFIFDGIPQEKSRLTAALLEKKVALLKQ